MPPTDPAQAVSAYGASLKAKLSNPAATGAPEDQLRNPLEALFLALADHAGLGGAVALVGENTLAHLKARPDFAVSVHRALVGFVEVKAPGKGADPRRFTDPHDRRQWDKLRALPNLLYTDGQSFSLWRDGELQGRIVSFDDDIATAGGRLAAPPTLMPLVTDFLQWSPVAPRNARQLAEIAARLCRLLRDEVREEMERGSQALTDLAGEWRGLLFPQATEAEFADGYAQAVTFGLLVARAKGIALGGGIDAAASALRRSNSLIGTALRLLTDDVANQQALRTSLDTLARVLDAVDWDTLTRGQADAWLYFYEDFLGVYDNALRKRTGSYYTPPQAVDAMVRLVHEALRHPDLFGRARGLACPEVTIADPAMGTGTYLLGVLRAIAAEVEADQGAGAVPGAIAAAAERLIGFELQFGPFAVAQLRLMAEMQALVAGTRREPGHPQGNVPSLRLFVTDTLGDPYAAQTQFSAMTAPIGESRKQANAIKRGEPITVVIGNPPYKDKANDFGGWIEKGSTGRAAAMDLWSPPVGWGVSAHAKHLKNLYVFFWRWATWKVFGSGHAATTGEAESERAGIVCFITAAGFLNGPGFQKMRAELRRDCSFIWVIDCSPEGHQPDVATRIFQGVQQPVCIVLAARTPKDPKTPARLFFRALPKGRREDKFAALKEIGLHDGGWAEGPSGWREPFLTKRAGSWQTYPALSDLFFYNGSGVMPGRTWIIAPDVTSLSARWSRLIQERDTERKDLLFHPHQSGDRTVSKPSRQTLTGHERRTISVNQDNNHVIKPTRYAYRSFDRQWIIPDARLINRPNPNLWDTYSRQQVFLTAPDDQPATSGPALSICGLIPDLHHYNGRGGRVLPLWRDAAATQPNLKPALLAHLSAALAMPVTPEDMLAYIAGLMAHPAFTARFQADLVRPGLRLPVTADAGLFREAVALGREVIWLHCYGERFADPAAGRPAGAPRLPPGEAPFIPREGAIPGAPEPLPDNMDHDPATNRLTIGKGFIENVPKAVFDYEVSGKKVLRQWFSYRRRDRSRPIIGDRRPPSPLDAIQPDHWPADYTSDLIDLLNVLGRLVKLEPAQADLLERICAGPLIDAATLEAEGALAAPPVPGLAAAKARKPRASTAQDDLFGEG